MNRFRLATDHDGYYLDDTWSEQKPLRIQFHSSEFLYRLRHAGKRSEMVLRALGARSGLKVLDCTAGLGRDAFLLAHAGCEVTMLERSGVLAMMLADALRRAQEINELAVAANRLSLHRIDAAVYLAWLLKCHDISPAQPSRFELPSFKDSQVEGAGRMPPNDVPDLPAQEVMANLKYDVVYIDPMFPVRDKSALVKGDMQQLQQFLGGDEDATGLITLALATQCPRVVVKRPAWLAPSTLAHHLEGNSFVGNSFVGKTSRFEVFFTHQQGSNRPV